MNKDLTIDEALAAIDRVVTPLPVERVPLEDCAGRRLAADLASDVDSPPHDKSLMDGYAVKATDLAKGVKRFWIVATITAGEVPSRTIETGEAARIMTGAPICPGSDTVVMRERVAETGCSGDREWVVLDTEPLPRGHHILPLGACLRRGELVLQAGHLIRAADVGLLAELGIAGVPVYSRPTLAVLATGNELIPHNAQRASAVQNQDGDDMMVERGAVPLPGSLRNSNGPLVAALASARVTGVKQLGIARDDLNELKATCRRGLEHRVFVLSGGVSEGIADLVPRALGELGVECVFHKVAIKPGKPIWFGVRGGGTQASYVFGLPGNPLSTLVCFQVFVRACLDKLTGGAVGWPKMWPAELAGPHAVRGPRPTFWPVRLVTSSGPRRMIEPLRWEGSSDQRCLVEADGFGFFPPRGEDYPAGSIVEFFPHGTLAAC